MSTQPIMTHAQPATAPAHNKDRTLRRTWLLAARVFWVLFFVFCVAVFARSVRTIFIVSRLPCVIRYEWTSCIDFEHALRGYRLSFESYTAYFLALQILSAVIYFALAILIAVRQSDRVRGLLFSLFLILLGAAGTWFNPLWQWFSTFPRDVWYVGALPDFIPANEIANVLTQVLYLGIVIVCYTFPDGRFSPRWMRWPAGAWGAIMIGWLLFRGTVLDWETWPMPVPAMVILVVLASLTSSLLYRYKHLTEPILRQQLKWFAVGITMPLLNVLADVTAFNIYPYLSGGLYPIPRGDQQVVWELIQDTHWYISSIIFAICIAVIVFRYRLWDIDLIINRALVYGALTALVIAFYVLVVGALGALIQTSAGWLVSVLATGFVAILFQPIRQRLQRSVNRLMYGERDDPYTVLERLGQRMEATLAPDLMLSRLVETIAQALRLPYAAIVGPDGSPVLAEYGTPTPHTSAWPLVFQGEGIGRLVVAPRAPGEAFSPVDRRLLDNIAYQAGEVVQSVRLTADLQRSRERLVLAREEERRHLRRELHDGLGPTLAALALNASQVSEMIATNPAGAEALASELETEIRFAVAGIRRMVYDLRPPALDELGLLAAIRERAAQINVQHQAKGGLRITVDAPERLPTLPAAVEVAAYRIVQEALANAQRHANAQTCTVQIVLDNALHLVITDDGRGLPADHKVGVGLLSMRERAEELGGWFEIDGKHGGGTHIRAAIPVIKE